MINAKDILIKLKGDDKDFKGAMAGADTSMKDFAKTVGTIAVGAVAALAGGMVILINETINYSKELDSLHKKLGIGIEDLDAYKYAAGQANVEFNDFTEAIKDMIIKQGEAAQGNKTAMESFNAIGVSIYNSTGELKDSKVLFEEVAIAISKIEDPGLRAAHANQLMADNGIKVLPILDDIQGFIEDTDYAKIHGLVMTDEEVQQMVDFGAEMDKLATYTSAFGRALASEVLPHLTVFNGLIAESVEDNGIGRLTAGIVGFTSALYGLYKILYNIGNMIVTTLLLPIAMFLEAIGVIDDSVTKYIDKMEKDWGDITKGGQMIGGGIETFEYGLTGTKTPAMLKQEGYDATAQGARDFIATISEETGGFGVPDPIGGGNGVIGGATQSIAMQEQRRWQDLKGLGITREEYETPALREDPKADKEYNDKLIEHTDNQTLVIAKTNNAVLSELKRHTSLLVDILDKVRPRPSISFSQNSGA